MFFKKRSKVELTPAEREERRAKAEAAADKAMITDIKRSKYFSYIALVLVGAILLSSIIFSSGDDKLKGGLLYTAVPIEDVKLDPHKTINYWEAGVCSLIYEGLVKSQSEMLNTPELNYENSIADSDEYWTNLLRFDVEPLLAQSWLESPDGLTWTFKLKQGIKFHDGKEFKASAVIASFTRLLGFETFEDDPSQFPIRKIFIRKSEGNNQFGIKKITKINDYEVEFQLFQPDSLFLQKLALPQAAIIAPALVSREIADKTDITKHPIGTGPYIFVRQIEKNFVVLAAYEEYWHKNEAFKGINLFFVGNDSVLFNAVKSEELDIITATTMLSNFKAEKNDKLGVFKGTTPFNLSFVINPNANSENSTLLQNQAFRKELLAVLDNREIYKSCMNKFYDNSVLLSPVENKRNIEDEAELLNFLEAQGFNRNNKLKLQFTFPFCNTGLQPEPENIAEEIKNQLSPLNIELVMVGLPENEFFNRWVNGEISFTIADFSLDQIYTTENFFQFSSRENPQNFNFYKDAKNKKDFLQARKSATEQSFLKQTGRLNAFYVHILDIQRKKDSPVKPFFEMLISSKDQEKPDKK